MSSVQKARMGVVATDGSHSPDKPTRPQWRGLAEVRVRGFRSIRDASFRPGPVSALVGEPGTGKSNLLAAIRAVLDPGAAPLGPEDVAKDDAGPIEIGLETGDGVSVSLEGTPPSTSLRASGALPPALYLPAGLRTGDVVASVTRSATNTGRAKELMAESGGQPGDAEAGSGAGATEAAHSLVAGIEACCQAGLTGMVVLIEEPELFLPPQIQRYLYRQLRDLAALGNQVLYSTHSPSFLNVARLHELVLTENVPPLGTRLVQPKPLPADDEFRAYSEFDASRSELFLARAAILVEGQTERLALPFVFRALGHDADRERISIVECGGKANIPLVARIAKAAGVPFIAVHDRDAPAGKKPNEAEQYLNKLIGEVTDPGNRFELAPDFEGASGLRGHRHKPARAWRSFASLEAASVPTALARIVKRALAIAGE